MKHPTPEELLPLLQAVDTAVWAMSVKNHTKTGQRCKVDWKGALKDLILEWERYQIKMSDLVAVTSEEKKL